MPAGMGSGEVAELRRSPLAPGAPLRVSELIVSVPVPLVPGDGPMIVDALRRARSAGITTFDAAGSPDAVTAEGLLARAFPQVDPAIAVLTRPEQLGDNPYLGRPGLPPAVRSPSRSGPDVPAGATASARFPRVMEVESVGARSPSPAVEGGAEHPGDSPPTAVVVRCRSIEDVRAARRAGSPSLLSGTFSLLDHELALAAAAEVGLDRVRWIARDPFAGGRLDGRRFEPATLGRRPSLPSAVRDLEADFAPVARLGFLARPGRRTLAQAALRFLLDRPWVVGACIPLPVAERWKEIVGFRSAPALDDEERLKVETIASDIVRQPATREPFR